MASIILDNDSPYYRICFRRNGRNVNRSLKTPDKRRAVTLCSRIEEALDLISRGRVEVPAGIGAIDFVLSDGRRTKHVKQAKPVGLTELHATYEEPGRTGIFMFEYC